MKAMIFSAGLGTRLKPFTDKQPKALALVNEKSLLQRNILFLASFGIKDIIINVHHFAQEVINVIKANEGFGSNIAISDESRQLLETGGGLEKASWYFDDGEPFIVMNVDILTDMDIRLLVKDHLENRPLATLAVTDRITSRYFLFDESGNLCGWKNEHTGEQKMSREIKTCTQKAFSGIHIISPEIFALMQNLAPHYSNYPKFSLVQFYLELAKTHVIKYFDHSNTKFIDVGKPASIAEAELLFTT